MEVHYVPKTTFRQYFFDSIPTLELKVRLSENLQNFKRVILFYSATRILNIKKTKNFLIFLPMSYPSQILGTQNYTECR